MNFDWIRVVLNSMVVNDIACNDIVYSVSIMTVSISCKNLIPLKLAGIIVIFFLHNIYLILNHIIFYGL